MYMWKVTIFAKKPWKDSPFEMSWIAIADTSKGAIEQVMDDLDLTGVEIEKVVANKENKPILINIKE